MRLKLILSIGVAIGFGFGFPATAQQVPDEGCFERHYSQDHLAENPRQGVSSIRMKVFQADGLTDPFISMSVTMSDQGQALADNVAGQVLTQNLYCQDFGDTYGCGVECDGGWIEVTGQSDDSITFRTSYLRIGEGEGCGGFSDLAEPGGGYTTYRLNTAKASICDGL